MRIPIRGAGRADDCHGNGDEHESGGSPSWPRRMDEDQADREDDNAETVIEAETVAGGHDKDEDGDGVWKDRYVRLLADFENHKRHTLAERERLAGLGKESVLDDVFPLLEHMERAQKALAEASDKEAIAAGLALMHRQIVALLSKHGIERVETAGAPFDPHFHEAIAVIPGNGVPADTVIEEISPGFTRGGKLLRPARVVVAKS